MLDGHPVTHPWVGSIEVRRRPLGWVGLLTLPLLALVAGCGGPTEPALSCTERLEALTLTPAGLEDHTVRAVEVGPDGGVYAGTDTAGVFLRPAGASEWRRLGLVSRRPVSTLLLVTGSPDLLFAGLGITPFDAPPSEFRGEPGLYLLTGSRGSWTAVDTELAEPGSSAVSVFDIEVDPGNSDRMFYVGSWLARSEDRGQTWVSVHPFGSFDIEWSPHGDGLVWAICPPDAGLSNFLCRSRDRGADWDLFTVDPDLLSLHADPELPGVLWGGTLSSGVHRSDDGGSTWQNVLGRRGIRFTGIYQAGSTMLAFGLQETDPGKPVFGPATLRLFGSCDRGESWTELATPDGIGGAQVVHPAGDEGELLMGTRGAGLWRVEF